jgi:flagellar motor switch protein FliN/FliY
MGAPAPEAGEGDDEPPVSELELSAIAEAANQTMAAAAGAIGVVLGQAIEISSPDTRVLDDPGSAADIYGAAPHATMTTFLIAGEACRLIQLVPSAFVTRMVRAMDELSAERTGSGAASAEDGTPHSVPLHEALGGINLRLWAELGRARMPLGGALGLPVGAVVDLDRAADAPVDLYVNGLRFGRGQLLVTDDGEWAVSVDEIESAGLRLLDLARSARTEPREDVEAEPQTFDSEPDQPIETEASTSDPETPEIPDLKQAEVEGAVT